MLFRGPGLDGERMYATGKLFGQLLIDRPVPVDTAHSGKGLGDNTDAEVGLAAFAPAAMAAVFLGLVNHLDRFG